MKINDETVDETGETAGHQDSGKPSGFENIKNNIADKLHNVADALNEKVSNAAIQDEQSQVVQYEKLASEWLEHSAEYIRQFDYKQTDARLKQSIKKHPGRSLLIAGGVGLIIGAMLRHR